MNQPPDHFGFNAPGYRRFRPRYPQALYDWLAQQAPARALAWDAGTGSGQAAVGLAAHFAQVFASDPSEAQIAQAEAHPRVRYAVEAAEHCSLADGSADLVSVATAFHWLPRAGFYAQVQRVLKPGGVLAIWAYHRHEVAPAIDAWILRLQNEVLGPYWPRGIDELQAGYRDIGLPFPALQAPAFAITQQLPAAQFLDYLRTWSGVDRYRRQHGEDPVSLHAPELLRLWGEGAREVRWPLVLVAGRKPG